MREPKGIWMDQLEKEGGKGRYEYLTNCLDPTKVVIGVCYTLD